MYSCQYVLIIYCIVVCRYTCIHVHIRVYIYIIYIYMHICLLYICVYGKYAYVYVYGSMHVCTHICKCTSDFQLVNELVFSLLFIS